MKENLLTKQLNQLSRLLGHKLAVRCFNSLSTLAKLLVSSLFSFSSFGSYRQACFEVSKEEGMTAKRRSL